MPRESFKVGDRVRMRSPEQLPADTVGIVVHVYTALQEAYYVGFGDQGLALLRASELDRVVDAPRPLIQTREQPPAEIS